MKAVPPYSPPDAPQWAIETMLEINRLTPDVKGKAFHPDWFKLRERIEEAARDIERLDWLCKEQTSDVWQSLFGFKTIPTADGIRQAIDAAIRQEKDSP